MKWLKNILTQRYGNIRFRLMDINCMGYYGLIGLLLIFFHRTVNNWQLHILIHIGIIVAILEIARVYAKYPHNKTLKFVRIFYPISLILYGWREIDVLARMIYGNFWSTDHIIHLEKLIFGVYPTIWFQQFFCPWRDELMNFFYDSYYLFMPIVSLTLFFKRKDEAAIAAFSLITAVLFSNFILFYLFPTLGPHDKFVEWKTLSYTGYIFGEITRTIQANGSIRGGAIPSSHVSAALAWALIALRYERKLGYFLLPMSLGVGIATVYLGYHYALDPICGYIWCLIVYPIVLKLIKKRGEEPLEIPSTQ
ncbi:MAG: phosphatase PAP2 family protein [bacterium]|nr:MAG: phosphatase PAP2 family protein [bacterium]